MATITLEDGRTFPEYQGEALSWSLELYNTWNEEQADFPKARAVLAELSLDRLTAAYSSYLRDSFDRIFGHNAKKILNLIEAEIEARRVQS